MVDLRPWRLPVAVVLVIATSARVGASLASFASDVGAGEVLLCVALAAVCWWCSSDQVGGARGLSIVAFVLVVIQVLLTLGACVALFLESGGGAARLIALIVQLTWLVVPCVAAAVLLRCARSDQRRSADTADQPALSSVEPLSEMNTSETDTSETETPEVETSDQPYSEAAGWAPDEAAGAAWRSAGEAAKGGSAAGWGSAAGSGWEPDDWTATALPPAPDDTRREIDP